MSYVSVQLLKAAVEAIKGKHPLAVAILPSMVRAGVRVVTKQDRGRPYGSGDEVALLKEFFAVPGAPAGKPYRAIWETQKGKYWRDDRYAGRSFQRMRTDRSGKGHGLLQAKRSGGKDLWGLTRNCGPELLDEAGEPVRLIDLAIWYGRNWDVADLSELQSDFLEEFPLNQDDLVGTLYVEGIPEEYKAIPLAPEPVTVQELQEGADVAVVLLESELSDSDDLLLIVQTLLRDGYAGVIFTGPPGTSKTWYAGQIAAKLTDGDPARVRFVQFHPSYQYEDFVEGFVPDEEGEGFELRPKHLLEMCDQAAQIGEDPCFLVIDELSRSDPARVFGEALTYIESTKRGIAFRLASGTEVAIPANLFILATMNEFDRGVDEVDAAFERRFARIQMDPNPAYLDTILTRSGMPDQLRARVRRFFMSLSNHREERARIGHAYFDGIRDEEGLQRLWDHQLRFQLSKAFRLNPDTFDKVERDWKKVFKSSGDSESAADQSEAIGDGNTP